MRASPILIVLLGLALTIGAADAGPASISAAEAAGHAGESVKVCGLVAGAKYATEVRGQPTFLNLDRAYPNQVSTALVWGNKRAAFPYAPESLRGQRICVKGTIELHKGRAEIIVSGPSQIERQR